MKDKIVESKDIEDTGYLSEIDNLFFTVTVVNLVGRLLFQDRFKNFCFHWNSIYLDFVKCEAPCKSYAIVTLECRPEVRP